MQKLLLSNITATYNSAEKLPQLIESLRHQTSKDFEWIIADGGSTDATLDLIKQTSDLSTVVDSHPDFGIYDALNRGIKLAQGKYYLVVGSDDLLTPNAVADYIAAAELTDADIISARIILDGRLQVVAHGHSELCGLESYISSHSVGAIFRRDLHDHLGYYSRKLPICADQLFVIQAYRAGAIIHRADFVAGEFTLGGTSASDSLGMITETCRAKIASGSPVWLQSLLLILRLLKNQLRIRNQSRKATEQRPLVSMRRT